MRQQLGVVIATAFWPDAGSSGSSRRRRILTADAPRRLRASCTQVTPIHWRDTRPQPGETTKKTSTPKSDGHRASAQYPSTTRFTNHLLYIFHGKIISVQILSFRLDVSFTYSDSYQELQQCPLFLIRILPVRAPESSSKRRRRTGPDSTRLFSLL